MLQGPSTICQDMGGWWPFKRKEPEPEVQEIIEYELGGADPASQTMEDRSHIEEKTYQNALSLLSSPHLGAPESEEVAHSTEVESESSPDSVADTASSSTPETISTNETQETTIDDASNWLHHTDGYWYRKDGAGGFEATAHTKESDGTFAPYSE